MDRRTGYKSQCGGFLRLFTSDPEILRQGCDYLRIIRGGGSPGFIMKVDTVCIWMIVLPLSFFMAFVVKADPAIVVCCLKADQVIKCLPGFLKVNYGHWIRQLTRE